MKIEVCCREVDREITPREGGSVVCRCGREWHAGRTVDGWRWFAVVPRDYSAAVNEWAKTISPNELIVLSKLAEHPGKVVSPRALLSALYSGYGEQMATSNVKVTIHKLREKLGERVLIHTARGNGYWLEWLEKPGRVR